MRKNCVLNNCDIKEVWYLRHLHLLPRPTQPPTLNAMLMSTGNSNALRPASEGRMCGWQVKLCEPPLTCAIPECLRGESDLVQSAIQMSCLLRRQLADITWRKEGTLSPDVLTGAKTSPWGGSHSTDATHRCSLVANVIPKTLVCCTAS